MSRPASQGSRAERAPCANCHGDGWVCENHASKGWPSVCDCGAGEPCPACNPNASDYARALQALRDIAEMCAEYDDGPFGHEGMPGDKVGAVHRIAQRVLLPAPHDERGG